MIDLHCHILPGIDDGARNSVESLELIAAELRQNVQSIVFTPHFNIDQIPMQEFLEKRNAALNALLFAAGTKETILPKYKCAAEVYLTPKLLECDLRALCIENTDYMLVELASDYYRQWTQDILYNIRMEGITPILAHVERYNYFSEMPEKLYQLICEGALAQVNASSIVNHKSQCKQITTYLKHNLVHIFASDAHSMSKRPPLLSAAFKIIHKKAGANAAQALVDNAEQIFSGQEIMTSAPTNPKKMLGFVF